MWIWQGEKENKGVMEGSHFWKEPCKICNQWIRKDEKFYLIIIPNEYSNDIKNFIVHKDEWVSFIEGVDNDTDLYNKLKLLKKPHRNMVTDGELQNIEFFKNACINFRFNNCVVSRDKRFIKMKKRGTSTTLIYDIVYDFVTCEDNCRKSGLFDGLFKSELLAKVKNEFNRLRGKEERDDFTVKSTIQKAVEETNKIFNR